MGTTALATSTPTRSVTDTTPLEDTRERPSTQNTTLFQLQLTRLPLPQLTSQLLPQLSRLPQSTTLPQFITRPQSIMLLPPQLSTSPRSPTPLRPQLLQLPQRLRPPPQLLRLNQPPRPLLLLNLSRLRPRLPSRLLI